MLNNLRNKSTKNLKYIGTKLRERTKAGRVSQCAREKREPRDWGKKGRRQTSVVFQADLKYNLVNYFLNWT